MKSLFSLRIPLAFYVITSMVAQAVTCPGNIGSDLAIERTIETTEGTWTQSGEVLTFTAHAPKPGFEKRTYRKEIVERIEAGAWQKITMAKDPGAEMQRAVRNRTMNITRAASKDNRGAMDRLIGDAISGFLHSKAEQATAQRYNGKTMELSRFYKEMEHIADSGVLFPSTEAYVARNTKGWRMSSLHGPLHHSYVQYHAWVEVPGAVMPLRIEFVVGQAKGSRDEADLHSLSKDLVDEAFNKHPAIVKDSNMILVIGKSKGSSTVRALDFDRGGSSYRERPASYDPLTSRPDLEYELKELRAIEKSGVKQKENKTENLLYQFVERSGEASWRAEKREKEQLAAAKKDLQSQLPLLGQSIKTVYIYVNHGINRSNNLTVQLQMKAMYMTAEGKEAVIDVQLPASLKNEQVGHKLYLDSIHGSQSKSFRLDETGLYLRNKGSLILVAEATRKTRELTHSLYGEIKWPAFRVVSPWEIAIMKGGNIVLRKIRK